MRGIMALQQVLEAVYLKRLFEKLYGVQNSVSA